MSLADTWGKDAEVMKDRPFEYASVSLVRPHFSLIDVGHIDSGIPRPKG